ncbi:hypothetical protein Dda_5555 [Drechslerella dactyloides]|uniref:3'-5' exonuclease domain-containing protein n=1 Tax=Drechslerella dactyloides TaxID=74499 RepID=A0AAD6IWR2_DREDA|nr:hypothetical protein Dda_5555 [Drechslerella dactyloides]
MSRRIRCLQVRAASTAAAVPRPAARCSSSHSYTFTAMDDDFPALPPHHLHSNPARMNPSSPATQAAGVPLPKTPNTPASGSRVWDPSRGIVFAPSPTSPWTPPSSRGFATSSPAAAFSEPASRTKPRIHRHIAKRPSNWADLLNLTSDGKEKPYPTDGKDRPSGLKDPERAALPDEFSPLNDTTALYAALEDEFDVERELEEQDEQSALALDDELLQGEAAETPAADIERVSTPEGEEIILWKKKPIVYTDETDEYVPPAFQVGQEVLEEQETLGVKLFGVENYRNADGEKPEVHYVTDVDKMETVMKLFEGEKVIGFDMEWHPRKLLRPPENDKDIRYSCSVIQVASADQVAIFHLAKYPANTKSWLSPTFKKIVEDPEVLKTGVSVRFDMQRLATVINISPAGALELAEFHSLLFAAQKSILEEGQKLPASLASLCQHHLGFPLYKGDVRTSDWSGVLNVNQRKYAADDAYASFRVFDEMEKIRRSLDPRPALPPSYSMVHEEVVEAWHKKAAKQAAEASDDTPKKKTVIRVPKKDLNPDLEEAYEWVKAYAKTVPGEVLKATVADLRCYTMWHNQDLEIEEVASKCRNPPLTEPYVAQKILEAVHAEKLPYDPRRLHYVFETAPKQGIRRYYDLRKEMNEAIAKQKKKPVVFEEAELEEVLPDIRFYGTQNPETEKNDPPARVRADVSKLKIRRVAPATPAFVRAESEPELILPTSNRHRRQSFKNRLPDRDSQSANELGEDEPLAMHASPRPAAPRIRWGSESGAPAAKIVKIPGFERWGSSTKSIWQSKAPTTKPARHEHASGTRVTTRTMKFGVSGELADAVGGLSGEASVRLTDGAEVDDEDLLEPPPVKRERKVFVPRRRRKVDGDGGS